MKNPLDVVVGGGCSGLRAAQEVGLRPQTGAGAGRLMCVVCLRAKNADALYVSS